jgi:hypothetical protein
MLHLLKLSKTVVKTKDQLYQEFRGYINMGAGELGKWLDTKESKCIDLEPQDSDILSRKAGERTIKILRKKPFELTKSNYDHMERAIAFFTDKLSERPEGDVTETLWRYTLKNWGYDPLKNGTRNIL